MRKPKKETSTEQDKQVATPKTSTRRKPTSEAKQDAPAKKPTKKEATPAAEAKTPAPKKAVKPSPAKPKAAEAPLAAPKKAVKATTAKAPAKKKAAEPEKLPTKSKTAQYQPPVIQAPAAVKKGPVVVKSLAELVEEEKLNPKPRPKPKPKAKAPEPVVAPEPQEPKRDNRTRQKAKAPATSAAAPTSAPQTESLEGLETESFEDVVVHWRAAEARPRGRGNGRKPQEGGSAPSERSERNERGSRGGRNRRGRGGRSQEAPERSSEPPAPLTFEPFDIGGESIQISFRTRDAAAGSGDTSESSAGRGRSRRGSKPRNEAPAAAAVAPEPPAPIVPVRPAIAIPDEAPQVVLRNGTPTLVRNGRVYPPIGFFGSAPDERRSQTILAEIQRAAQAGVHLHSILVEFEVEPSAVEASVGYAAYMSKEILQVDPEAQILFRLVFAAPPDWEQNYPDAKYAMQNGRTAEPSLCDEKFWAVAKTCLSDFVHAMRRMDFKDSILGIHLDRGEWFFPEGVGYDVSSAATRAFRDWLRARYVNDAVAFRAAWFDGQVTFATAAIPAFQATHPAGGFMRTSRKERRWVDYHLFLSDSTYALIADLAYVAKEASEGYFLCGVSYGYTFEWTHPASGHLSLGKVLRTREIDFIAGPPSYRSREPGGDAPFPCPIDSLTLNGKLYISEEDFKTAIGDYKEPDDYNPVIKTPQALEAMQWRGAGSSLAHSSGSMWMDLWGNGWLNTAAIWDRSSQVIDCMVKRMAAPPADPDVAVFIDERALAYLVDERSFALLVQDVRESVLRSGLSAGFYLMSDLAHRDNFPECKLYIFLNAWDIRPEHRLAIKNRLQRDGKTLFWLYCAGMFDNGRESLERVREVTGIAIKPQPYHSRTGTTVLSRRHPLCEAFAGQGLIGGANVDPSYFAIPENSLVLGEYSQSGLPSFVIREFNEDPDPSKRWRSVFLGEPYVTPGLLRALAQISDCHIWNYHSDVAHVRPPFVAIHCSGAGSRAIALPKRWEAYNLITGQWVDEESSAVRFQALDGSTHLYLVGLRSEIEQILAADPTEWLKMESLPERLGESSHDPMLFDVPIMRLDEVFGETPDDVGDEWFLKPGMLELEDSSGPARSEPAEVEREVGRRRRKRSDKRRPSGAVTGEAFDDELGMSVMFRKRE